MGIKEAEVRAIIDSYCTGCGVCSIRSPLIQMKQDSFGAYKPVIMSEDFTLVKESFELCPFSSQSLNEDQLASEFFVNKSLNRAAGIGTFLRNYVGYASDPVIRGNGSSGGLLTWVLIQLFEKHFVDEVIHVKESVKNGSLFDYSQSRSVDEIREGASSKYYAVEMSKVLEYIRVTNKRFVVVAVPCFVKAIRNLQKREEVFSQRIKFLASPFCGHLKTKKYVDLLALQAGILPKDLLTVNFRSKIYGKPSSDYGTKFVFRSDNGNVNKVVANKDFRVGTNWGHGMFKLEGCDYCDDTVGELSDISVGDAWIKGYVEDFRGHSVLIVRNEELLRLLNEGVYSEDISLEEISVDKIRESQFSGLRNKSGDLQYRLYLKDRHKEWRPTKRVQADRSAISSRRKAIVDLRIKISAEAKTSFLKVKNFSDLKSFYLRVDPLIKEYNKLYFSPSFRIKKALKQILRFLGLLH